MPQKYDTVWHKRAPANISCNVKQKSYVQWTTTYVDIPEYHHIKTNCNILKISVNEFFIHLWNGIYANEEEFNIKMHCRNYLIFKNQLFVVHFILPVNATPSYLISSCNFN